MFKLWCADIHWEISVSQTSRDKSILSLWDQHPNLFYQDCPPLWMWRLEPWLICPETILNWTDQRDEFNGINENSFLLLLTFRPAGGDKLPQKTDSVAGRIFHYHNHVRSSAAWVFVFCFFNCILHLLHPHRLPLVKCVHPVQWDRNSRQEEAASLTHGEDVDMWIL